MKLFHTVHDVRAVKVFGFYQINGDNPAEILSNFGIYTSIAHVSTFIVEVR